MGGLPLTVADHMIENCIGKVSIPMGLGLNFIINGEEVTIPMAVEEPSIVAASSGAAKFIRTNSKDGFIARSTQPIVIGQLQLLDCEINKTLYTIDNHKKEIIQRCNAMIPKMVQRGGGV